MKTIPGLADLTIGSIFCIGRNYANHAKELGNNVPDQPMVFLKPASSLIQHGETIRLPEQSQNVHHEVELVIAIGKKGKRISRENTQQYVAGYGIGIDVTARDIQHQAKDRGHPWSVAKGFDTFAPVSRFTPADGSTRFNDMTLTLSVNGEMRQNGDIRNMIFSVEELVAHLSTVFTLYPGDLIFTGTPEGVSPINAGDSIKACLNNDDDEIELTIAVGYDNA